MIRVRFWCPTHCNLVEPQGKWPHNAQQLTMWTYRGQPVLVPSLDEHTHEAEHAWEFNLTDMQCPSWEDEVEDDCRPSWQVEFIADKGLG